MLLDARRYRACKGLASEAVSRPFSPGDVMQCVRIMKTQTEQGIGDRKAQKGHWIGACEVLCVESTTSETLSERVVWLNARDGSAWPQQSSVGPFQSTLPLPEESTRRWTR